MKPAQQWANSQSTTGSGTHETRAAMGKLTVDNLLSHLNDGTVISPVPECQ